MTSKAEELERKLSLVRGSPDRALELEQRMSNNRVLKRSQKERADGLEQNWKEGTDHVYGVFESNHKGAAARAVNILGAGAAEDRCDQVRAAISYASGIPSLDRALGGGIACGVTEIYGSESVGKSTLLMELIRSAQQQKMTTALCPTEVFDWGRATRIGVDINKLLVIRGKDDRVLSILSDFALEDERALFIDSATGIRPEEGGWWRMMLTWLENLRFGENSSVVMTDQVRARRSADPSKFFAGGTDSTAHRITSYFSTRMELSRMNVMEHEYDLIINIVANLYRAPYRIVTLPLVKTKGIDVWKDVVRVATQMNVLQVNTGHYFSYQGGLLGQGEETVARRLESNERFGANIFNETLRAMSR